MLTLPTQDTLIEYILDYGYKKACDIFHISENQCDDILYPKQVNQQYKYNTIIDKPLHKDANLIANVIANHFEELKEKYTKYGKNTLYMSQDVEDYFQRAIVKCMEKGTNDLSEDGILELFKIQFFTIRKYAQKSSFTMKDKLSALEYLNEDGEYFIPTEYNK